VLRARLRSTSLDGCARSGAVAVAVAMARASQLFAVYLALRIAQHGYALRHPALSQALHRRAVGHEDHVAEL